MSLASRRADQAHQPLDGVEAVDDAESARRDPELAGVRREPQVTRHRGRDRPAHAVAVDHRHRRLGAGLHRVGRRRRAGVVGLGRGAVLPVLPELGDVGPRGECLLARPAEHDRADSRVADQALHHPGQRAPHREVEGVPHVRPVEHDGRDVARAARPGSRRSPGYLPPSSPAGPVARPSGPRASRASVRGPSTGPVGHSDPPAPIPVARAASSPRRRTERGAVRGRADRDRGLSPRRRPRRGRRRRGRRRHRRRRGRRPRRRPRRSRRRRRRPRARPRPLRRRRRSGDSLRRRSSRRGVQLHTTSLTDDARTGGIIAEGSDAQDRVARRNVADAQGRHRSVTGGPVA